MNVREYRTLEFPVLDVMVITDKGIFRDDGFVDDIGTHSEKLLREFHVYSEGPADVPGMRGRTWAARTDDSVFAISYYLRSNIPIIDTFVQGHEQTHALHALGLIGALETKLRDHGYLIDLRSIPYKWNQDGDSEVTNELVADVGGLYALIRSGHDPAKFLINHPNNPHILKAYCTLGQPFSTLPA